MLKNLRQFKNYLMADKYNFSKLLSQIISPVLGPLGFKKKGAKFVRKIDGSSYVIQISKSVWNGPIGSNQLSLYIHVISEDLDSSVLLHRPTTLKFPSHYAPFFQDKLDWPEKSALMQSFSKQETEEIDEYINSISWKYNNEVELTSLFEELKDQILKVAIPTLDIAEYLDKNDSNSFSFSDKMRKHAKRLYLSQLNAESKFPEE